MVWSGMLRRRWAWAAAAAAAGGAAVIAVAVVESAGPAPGRHPVSLASRPVSVSLVARFKSPEVTPVAMALHGTLAAGTGSAALKDGGICLWETATGRVTAVLPVPAGSGGIGPLAFSPDGTILAEGAVNGSIYLWDIATGKVTATLATPGGTGPGALSFSPDGRSLAEASTEGRLGIVYLWDVAARKVTAKSATVDNPYGITAVAFAPGGTTVAVGEATGTILLWDTRTGTTTVGPADPKSDSGTWVGAIAFGPGGTMAAGYNGGTTYLWDARGTLTAAFTDPAVRAVFSGRRATVNGLVLALWFGPGGTTVTAADGEGDIYLWRLTR